GAVDDVAVPGHPADVGGAPVDVVVALEIEDEMVGRGGADQIAAGGVQDAFGFRGRAGRVQQIERMLGVQLLGRAIGRLLWHDVVVPDVASVRHRDVLLGSAQHDALFYG